MVIARSRTDSLTTFLGGEAAVADLIDQIINTRLFGWVRPAGGKIQVGYAGDPHPAEEYVLEGLSGQSHPTGGSGD